MEEESDFQAKLFNFIRSNFLFLALFSAGIVFLGIGLVQMFGAKTAQVTFEKGSTIGSEVSSNTEIKVDVDGSVTRPGLYTLKSDARIQDALIAAGGLSPNANRRAINLAAKVADGQKIYIPAEGETASPPQSSTVLGAESSNALVSINSGSESELDTLPGVGPVTAKKIIDNRPYGSLEELVSKKAVGQKTFENISGLISL